MPRRPWELPEHAVTPEWAYRSRRELVRDLGLAAGALVTGACATKTGPPQPEAWAYRIRNPRLNARYPHDRERTPERWVSGYNNFYEFTTVKDKVWEFAQDYDPTPWKVEVTGLVEAPRTFDLDDLTRQAHEERVYRLRCVEAWSMVVPWAGFPLKRLLDKVRPLSSARFVRFVTKHDPERMVGMRLQPHYPWPYHEALRLDEALNDLTFLATGLYGHALPMQNGAPLRLVVPWKYGFKSIKSIVKIELVKDRPTTFWNTAAPDEYGFLANVDPAVPHPRWSQATERVVPSGERVPTLPFNGYGEWVAGMYAG